MKRSFAIVVAVLALALVACGSDNKVGDESLVNFKDQANQRLGATTTTVAVATTAPARGALGVGATTTTRPVATTAPRAATTIPADQTYEIAINGDNQASTQFDPSPARVYRGTIVKWENKDTTARSVISEDGTTLKSPMIPPGGTWTYKADKAGTFNYEDGTRPYATGTLEVLNK